MRIFSYEELDELGEGLIRQYLGKEAERTCCVDIEGFVTDFLKLPLLYRSFAEEDSDKNLFSFRETQVDRMGAALLMPRFMVRNAAAIHGCTDRIPVYGDSVLRTADKLRIKQVANAMGVSFSAFLIRLRELDCLCYRPLAEYITEEMGLGQDGGAG